MQVMTVPVPVHEMTTRVGIWVITRTREVMVECAEALQACVTTKVADVARYTKNVHGYLDEGRNRAVREFNLISAGLFDQQLTYFMMVDSDIGFWPQDVAALAAHDLPVVSGVYHSQWPDGIKPILYQFDDQKRFQIIEKWEDGWPWWPEHRAEPPRDLDPLVRIGAAGAGFLMIRRDVIQQLYVEFGEPVPWFAEPIVAGVHYGEDLGFFRRLDRCGIPAYADRSVQVTHYKNMAI